MTNEKKPSIYSDRSAIGSSGELDEYGVWVKSGPLDLSSVNTDSQNKAEILPEGEDLPDFKIEAESEGGEEEEDFAIPDPENLSDFDLSDEKPFPDETDETLDALLRDTAEIPDDLFDISDIDLEGLGEGTAESGADLDESALSPGTSQPSKAEDVFTDVSMRDFLGDVPENLDASLFTDLSGDETEETGLPETFQDKPEPKEAGYRQFPAKTPEDTAKGLDLSTQLLMKIADELSSIKTEIFSLKQELLVIRNAPPAESGQTTDKSFFEKPGEEETAPTGDERNPILNTANLGEEAGSDAAKSTMEARTPEEPKPGEAAEQEEGSSGTITLKDTAPLVQDETVALPTEDESDLAPDETVDLPAEDEADLAPDEAIDLPAEDESDLAPDETVDLPAEDEADLAPDEAIDL
ncbi:MAG: hypothetical protein LBL19_04945, partial [Spirochaetaceae bacterium]|nr:hypothetical protein [Spirochaetaceae bacterium]